ncbi:MAG: hypothetical protein KGI33_01730 [Thaumarchaeota archaeon]|nr:hypothetical protein [Nitrososphaerota archaeon]
MSQKKPIVARSAGSGTQEDTISVCDIIHSSANSIIEKMESLLPVNMELYSNFYTEVLHSAQDLFGACYIAENEILSKLGVSQKTLQAFGNYSRAATSMVLSQIEMANNVQRTSLQNQIAAVKSTDEYIRLMLDYYSAMLAGSLHYLKRT